MFNWYEQADICYAYLEDLRGGFDDTTFASRRWFWRGWTLQELIAPSEVVVFNSNWRFIASRGSVAAQLARITGIDEAVLRSSRDDLQDLLSSYSIAQRMAWASERKTTRIEDRAYSLLGLFDVNMPLLYGEGPKAFQRLQEEILRTKRDFSILAWSSRVNYAAGNVLANSIENFAQCTALVPFELSPETESVNAGETTLTNVGVRVIAPIMMTSGTSDEVGSPRTRLAMILNCRHRDDITTVVALKLWLPMEMSELSDKELGTSLQWGNVNCLINCYGESDNRLMRIDVLEAAKRAQIASVIMARTHWPMIDLMVNERRSGWTHVWIRFSDSSLRDTWTTLDMHPKQYWRFSNRTFDLLAARDDIHFPRMLHVYYITHAYTLFF